MVMNIENKLRLYLGFKDELNAVSVTTNTGEWDPSWVMAGPVKGKEQIVDLLKEAGIDYVTTRDGSSSLPVAHEIEPRRMVETVEGMFRTVHETQVKILRGEEPTEEELGTRRPTSLSVFSSSTTAREGLPLVRGWFKKNVQQNKGGKP
jgi:hypothetical protein